MSDKPTSPKPISEAQLLANRANAQKSRGPVTPEGKARSAANSTTHGLTGRAVHVPPSEEERYADFTAALLSDLRPASALELQLSHTISDAYWRLNHIRSVEEVMFTLPPEQPAPRPAQRPTRPGALHRDGFDRDPIDPDTIAVLSDEPPAPRPAEALLTAARAFLHRPHAFTNVTLYEQRLQRTIKTSMEELRRLQAERETRLRRDMPTAIDFYKERRMHNLPFDPAENGFVFSIPEIEAAITREYRERKVREAKACRFHPGEYQKRHGPKAA